MRTRLLFGLILVTCAAAAGCRSSQCGSTSAASSCDNRCVVAPAARPTTIPIRSTDYGVPLGYPTTYSPVSYAPPPTVTYGPPVTVSPIPPAPVPPSPANELPFPAAIPSPNVPTAPANQLPLPSGFGK